MTSLLAIGGVALAGFLALAGFGFAMMIEDNPQDMDL